MHKQIVKCIANPVHRRYNSIRKIYCFTGRIGGEYGIARGKEV